MEKFIKNMPILIARIIVIGFFSGMYVIPVYFLLYLIMFNDFNWLSETSLKFFFITYSTSFLILYRKYVKTDENSEN